MNMVQQNYNNRDIDDLLIKYLIGSSSKEERAQIDYWLNENEENRRYFDQLKDLYYLGKVIKRPSGFDKEKSLNRIKLKYYKFKYLELKQSLNPAVSHQKRYKFTISIAAIFLLTLSLSFYFGSLLTTENKIVKALPKIYNEIVSPRGSRTIATLPDGTRVWLNAGSSLRYSGNYSINNRDVELTGEAYFLVKTNPDIPFTVVTSELKIKALGTAFNVKAYPEEKVIATTLEEGILKITGKGIDISLRPKQSVLYVKRASNKTNNPPVPAEPLKTNKIPDYIPSAPGISEMSNVNTEVFTAWKDDKLILDSENLANISVILERKFNVSIHLDSGDLVKYKFRGTFTNETLEQILDAICLSAPLNYTINKGNVIIKADKYRKSKYTEILKNNY